MSADPIAKLKKPPFVHNFVRQIGESESATIKKAVDFALAKITKTYLPSNKIILDILRFGIAKEVAVKAALLSRPINSRKMNADFVSEFHDFVCQNGIINSPSFLDDISPYRAAHDVVVPVKPSAIIAKPDGLTPLFAFGWASIPFSDFQFRLMMTIIEDAVFTLDDYRESNGIFVAFPKVKNPGGEYVRTKLEWKRGDYSLMSRNELRDIFEYYKSALVKAEEIVRESWVGKRAVDRSEDTVVDFGQSDLFSK